MDGSTRTCPRCKRTKPTTSFRGDATHCVVCNLTPKDPHSSQFRNRRNDLAAVYTRFPSLAKRGAQG